MSALRYIGFILNFVSSAKVNQMNGIFGIAPQTVPDFPPANFNLLIPSRTADGEKTTLTLNKIVTVYIIKELLLYCLILKC